MRWQKVPMGEFLKHRDLRFKPKDQQIIGLKRIEKIDFSGNIFISNKPSNTDMILVKKGDLVISGINVEKGAMAVYQGGEDLAATIHYSSYEFDKSKIDEEFLKSFLKSEEFIRAIKEQVPGGIKTEIKPKHLLPLEVEIPSDVEDQKKIVFNLQSKNNKIESIDIQHTHQFDLLKKLRQQILQDAVQGKLVPQDPNDEPASKLLERIDRMKQQLIKDKKLKTGKSTDKPLSLIDEQEIPESWKWKKIDEIFFVTKLAGFEYTDHMFLKPSGEIPVIRAQNVRPIKIEKSNLLYLDKETSYLLDRCSLTKKCLLVTFIGAGIGDVATFDENERWHLAPNVAKVEPFQGCEDMVDVLFINYFLLSPVGQKEIFKHIKATAQPSLSMGTIRDIDVPIPPLFEQHRIVNKIKQLLKLCDELEQTMQQNQKYTQELLQVALKEALEPKD